MTSLMEMGTVGAGIIANLFDFLGLIALAVPTQGNMYWN